MRPRSLRPYAVVRAAVIVAFLAWVVLGVVPLLMPPKHARSTDATDLPKHEVESHTRETDTAARGIPPKEVNPQPAMGPVPVKPAH
jgi:hypothetical protein